MKSITSPLSLAAWLLCLGATCLPVSAHPPAGHVALRAGRTFDGQAWHDGAVVILHGTKIEALRKDGSVPPGIRLIEAADAVLTPGLVDLDSALGLGKHRDEWHESSSPDLRALDGFRPQNSELAALRRSGVTTVWLSAGKLGVLSGRGALVQPSALGQPAKVLSGSWGVSGSLSAASRIGNREPTSLAGQSRLLTSVFAEQELPGPARLAFDDAGSARAAIALGGVLVGRPRVGPGLDEIAAARALILSGLAPWHGEQVTTALLALQGEVQLGFGSDTAPMGPAWIRLAAARAVSAGLDPTEALVALTSSAADIAGLPGQRGSIRAGAAADLVLWTADPVLPAARALRVWVAGAEVLK